MCSLQHHKCEQVLDALAFEMPLAQLLDLLCPTRPLPQYIGLDIVGV